MMMLYIAYFASGVLGLGVALVSGLIAVMAVAEGALDPFIGWLIDRSKGRFGKFRPFMVLGNCIMALAVFSMYIGQGLYGLRLPVFIIAYGFFIIGYSFQFCVTRGAQSVLTNDPTQRPLISAFDMVFNVMLYVGITFGVSNFMVPRHEGFTLPMFGQFFLLPLLRPRYARCLPSLGYGKKIAPKTIYMKTHILTQESGYATA